MCQITYFFGKRPELSQKKSGTMFFKARYQFFLEFLDFFWFTISVILKMTILVFFFWKKNWFSIFVWQFFFTSFICEFFLRFFFKWSFWWQHFCGINFFSEIPKKIVIGPEKTLFRMFPETAWVFFPKSKYFDK